MLVRLMAERDSNECTTKMAGTTYKFKRNEYGHLVTEVTDVNHIAWVGDPHNSAFLPYAIPKPKNQVPVTVVPEVIAPVETPKEPEVVAPVEQPDKIDEPEKDIPQVPRREEKKVKPKKTQPKKVEPKKVDPKKKR